MILTINTNGTLIDERWAAFFGKHRPRRVNITLYGADERSYEQLCHYPGGFEKVIAGIRLLRDYDVDVKLSCSVTKQNRAELDRLFAIGEELGVPVRADTYMMPSSRERELAFDPDPHQSTLRRLLDEAPLPDLCRCRAVRDTAMFLSIKPVQSHNYVS